MCGFVCGDGDGGGGLGGPTWLVGRSVSVRQDCTQGCCKFRALGYICFAWCHDALLRNGVAVDHELLVVASLSHRCGSSRGTVECSPPLLYPLGNPPPVASSQRPRHCDASLFTTRYSMVYQTLVWPQNHILDGIHHPSTTAVIKRFAMAVCGGNLNAPST